MHIPSQNPKDRVQVSSMLLLLGFFSFVSEFIYVFYFILEKFLNIIADFSNHCFSFKLLKHLKFLTPGWILEQILKYDKFLLVLAIFSFLSTKFILPRFNINLDPNIILIFAVPIFTLFLTQMLLTKLRGKTTKSLENNDKIKLITGFCYSITFSIYIYKFVIYSDMGLESDPITQFLIAIIIPGTMLILPLYYENTWQKQQEDISIFSVFNQIVGFFVLHVLLLLNLFQNLYRYHLYNYFSNLKLNHFTPGFIIRKIKNSKFCTPLISICAITLFLIRFHFAKVWQLKVNYTALSIALISISITAVFSFFSKPRKTYSTNLFELHDTARAKIFAITTVTGPIGCFFGLNSFNAAAILLSITPLLLVILYKLHIFFEKINCIKTHNFMKEDSKLPTTPCCTEESFYGKDINGPKNNLRTILRNFVCPEFYENQNQI